MLFIFLLVFVAIFVGMLGYFAYGNACKSVILYNLPNDDILANVAKVFYIITIMGSYVLVVQPIFYVVESSDFYKRIC